MKNWFAGRFVTISAIVLFGCSAEPPQRAGDSELEARYRRLLALTAPGRASGQGAEQKELGRIRDYFVSTGERGAEFLRAKLDKRNQEEMAFLKGSDDFLDGMEFVSRLHEKGEGHRVKYEICLILGELAPRLSVEEQNRVLDSIASSYTPSSYGREDMQFLHTALLDAGPLSVSYFLRLFSHKNQAVRCGAASVLKSVGESIEPAPARTQSPPELDCRATVEVRSSSSKAWQAWWEEFGRFRPFPTIPK